MSKKRNTKNQGKNFLFICCLLLAIVAAIGICLKSNIANQNQNKNTTSVSQSEENLTINADVVEVSVNSNIAKIDCITPGLDTALIKVVLYDTKNNRIISETQLDEDFWRTGLTDNGFFAVSIPNRILYLYDQNGKLTKQKNFSDIADLTDSCYVSADEKYFLYTSYNDKAFYIYNLTDGSRRKIDQPHNGVLGFFNGKFYLTHNDVELAEFAPTDDDIELVFADDRITHFSPYYSAGTTEYSLLCASGLLSHNVYIPLSSIDEVIIGTSNSGIITAVSEESGTVLRDYNIEQKSLTEIPASNNIESVSCLDDGRLLVISGSSEEKKHKISFLSPSDYDKKSITLNDSENNQTNPSENITVEKTPGDDAIVLKDVPVLAQFPEFPTGCESVSAVMLLQYAGEDISIADFVDNYLDKNADFYYEDGKAYGPSPWEYFLGNPRSSSSYGCMAPVIEKAMVKYFNSTEKVKNITGTDLSDLCDKYIDNGIPVMTWVTIKMLDTIPQNTWYFSENGVRFSWPGNEHCMVLVGYDENYYYFNDPYTGKIIGYGKQTSEDHYGELGKQSIVILK